MERPHYRRVTGGGGGASNWAKQIGPTNKKSTFSERLVAQFIICGVIMALILVLNLINTSVTQNIKGIIQDQPTTDDVKQVIIGASDTVKAIFGKSTGDKAAGDYGMASGASMNNTAKSDSLEPSASPLADQSGPAAAAAAGPSADGARPAASQSPGDFRIDEDMLTKIQAGSSGQ